jgi:type IV pilus assembly protein PilN
MRLNINLASMPYEDIRRITFRWVTGLIVLLALTVGVCFYALTTWRESRDVNRQISTLKQEIRTLDAEKQAGLALLNRPDNRTTAQQSNDLNQLLARKAFSWTRVFMDLERLMPPGLHVVSVAPELTKSNQLLVRMKVGGTSRDRAIELVRRMEDSPTFKQAQVLSEAQPNTADGGDAIEFEITSMYILAAASAVSEAEKNQDANKPPVEKNSKPRTQSRGGMQ